MLSQLGKCIIVQVTRRNTNKKSRKLLLSDTQSNHLSGVIATSAVDCATIQVYKYPSLFAGVMFLRITENGKFANGETKG